MGETNDRLIVIKSPEEIRSEDLARLQSFRWIDDTFARSGFRNNPEIAQLVLRIITGIEDLTIDPKEYDTQYDAKRLAGSRSLMLDVRGGDTEGRKYDLEMEKSDASPERAEIHVATMVVEHLHEGVDKMCAVMEKERNRTVEERTLILMMNLMDTQDWDAQTAMDALKIPESERDLYARSAAYARSVKRDSTF